MAALLPLLLGGVFAFTGCTDYEEDINAINDRIDQLQTGEIADVASQVTSLKEALATAESTISGLESTVETLSGTTIPGLESRLEAVEALKTSLADLESDIQKINESLGDYATKEYVEATFATLDAIKTINADLGTVKGDLSVLEGKINDLETVEIPAIKESIEKAQGDADQAIADASAALGEIESLKEALKAYATKEELEVLSTKIEAVIDDVAGKLDITDFDKALGDALAAAIEEGGTITSYIAGQIEAAIEEYDIQGVVDLVNALQNKVEDIANRIQSLVFVPEYNDNCASLVAYTLFGEAVSDSVVIDATFRVTPASLAANLVSQQSENVFAYIIPVKTRAASVEETVIATAEDKTLKIEQGAKEGYINVELALPSEKFGKIATDPYAFALYVASKEDVETAAEGEDPLAGIDAGTYYSTDYVQVATSSADLELKDKYVLYNADAVKDKVYPTDTTYKVAWSVDPTLRYFYEGYTLHINFGTAENPEYLSLEDAAKKLRLEDASAITPAYGPYVTYSKDGIKDYFVVNQAVEPYGTSVDMAEDKEMTEVLGETVNVTNTFYFGEFSEGKYVVNNTQKYQVVNEPITINVNAADTAWSYALALKLADSETAPTAMTKNIRFNTVGYSVEGPLGEMDLAKVLTEGTLVDGGKKVTVKLDGEEVTLSPTPSIEVEAVDVDKNTVNIALKNYKFAQGGKYEYTFAYTYELADYPTTEYTVNFVVTLGAMPEDATVEYGEVELPFFTEGLEFIDLEDGYALAYEKAQAEKTWFKDAAEFKASLQLNNVTTKSVTKDETALTAGELQYTYLGVDPADAAQESSFIRFSSSVVKAIGEEFAFETEIKTWYGVTYTFTANGTIPDPEYKLAYDSANAPDGIVYLKYEENSDVYVLQTVDPANYLHVTGEIADLPADELTVSFEAVTKEDAQAGVVNIPALDKVLGVDVAKGDLTNPDNWVIDWSDYTARELEVKVILKAKDIVVDEKPLTIVAPELVAEFAAKGEPVQVTRKAGNDKVINLWEQLEAFAAEGYGDGKSFIPAGAAYTDISTVNASEAMALYGAEIKFDTQLIGKVADNGGSLIGSYDYDPLTGTLTYFGDNATIQSPVTFTIGATLTYYLDYNGKVQEDPQGAYRVELKVRISEE